MPDETTPEPVGTEFGIAPIRDRHLNKPPFTSRDLVGTDDYSTGTEFGGVAGLIQPSPHVPDAAERLHMVYAIDPTDPGDDPGRGSVAAPNLEF
jgi:hypothetical protein